MITTLLSCQCDSIVTKACGALIPIIKEACKADTNSFDVSIANEISTAVVKIFTICVLGFLAWKLLDHIANGISGFYKRRCEVKDKLFKQKGDLLDKLTDFLKSQTEEKDNDGKVIKNKPYENKECKAYRETICDILNVLKNKDSNIGILKETMKQEQGHPSETSQSESSNQTPKKWYMEFLRYLHLDSSK